MLLQEMKASDHGASLSAYNAAINACARGKQSSKALELMEEMSEVRLSPNVITFNSTINACARAKQWQKAVELLEIMKSNGVPLVKPICHSGQ